jgi:hypothetical protein
VDLLKGLDLIQENINNDVYANQYAFEADLGLLYQSAHDSHFKLVAGALAVFSFYTDNEIVSVSSDGIELPKLYLQGTYGFDLYFFLEVMLMVFCRAYAKPSRWWWVRFGNR